MCLVAFVRARMCMYACVKIFIGVRLAMYVRTEFKSVPFLARECVRVRVYISWVIFISMVTIFWD